MEGREERRPRRNVMKGDNGKESEGTEGRVRRDEEGE